MIVNPATTPQDRADNGGVTVFLSVAGGLTQFGAYLDTLMPGGFSSRRHWHSAEDEFLYLLDGHLTLIDNNGETALAPGDAVAWRHGDPNAHHLTNRSDTPARFLIIGSRCAGDVCTYPDAKERLVNGDTWWKIIKDDGTVRREGTLPDHLCAMPTPWGKPFDGTPRPNVLRKGEVAGETHPSVYPEPYNQIGDYIAHPLSDAAGLSQFGAFTETLMPGARSSQRHWHASEDEFLYTLHGTVTLHEDGGPQGLPPGACVCWPAGVPNAHCLENRTDQPVTYFVAGTRLPEDTASYPDIDLHYTRRNGLRSFNRKDGTPYPGWPKETTR